MSETSNKNHSAGEVVTNKELIAGRIYQRSPVTPKARMVADVLQAILQKYKLTTKPLDSIYEPFETIRLEKVPNSIIRPMLAVRTNKSENSVDWVVDYTESNLDPLAFCVKPVILNEAGVREYWVVDLQTEKIIIYQFDRNGFVPETIPSPRRIQVGIYKSLIINYSDIF